jgi:acyl-CoA synthetase (AMP-forming)/AMP-acid ligase II
LGELPGAVVYCHPGQTLDEAGLNAFLKDKIAAFKVPAKIWFEPHNLARLGTEKIDKVSLRKKYRAVWEQATAA